MHKAEGVLFRDALARAAETCGLRLATVPEKQLASHGDVVKAVAAMGKTVGPPWGKDQKDASDLAQPSRNSDGAITAF
jgi:hypothetical protein